MFQENGLFNAPEYEGQHSRVKCIHLSRLISILGASSLRPILGLLLGRFVSGPVQAGHYHLALEQALLILH